MKSKTNEWVYEIINEWMKKVIIIIKKKSQTGRIRTHFCYLLLLHRLIYISCISLSDFKMYFQRYIYQYLIFSNCFEFVVMTIFIYLYCKFIVSWVWPKHANTHFKMNLLVLHFLLYDFSQGLHFSTIKMYASLPSSVFINYKSCWV